MHHYIESIALLARDLAGTPYAGQAASLTSGRPASIEEARAIISTLLRLLARAEQERGREQ